MNRNKIKKYAVIIPIHNCAKLYLSTVTIPSQYFIDRLYESFQEIVDDEEVMSFYKEYFSIMRKYCTDCGLYTSTLIASSISYNKKDKNDAKALFEWNNIIKCLATITHSSYDIINPNNKHIYKIDKNNEVIYCRSNGNMTSQIPLSSRQIELYDMLLKIATYINNKIIPNIKN